MKIEVTQYDIDDGVPEDEFHCPIAVAIRRTLKPWIVEVGGSSVDLTFVTEDFTKRHQLWFLSEEGKTFVKRFDEGLPVEPFELELREFLIGRPS